MKKKFLIFLFMLVSLCGCSNETRKGTSLMVIGCTDRILAVYENGVEITDEYLAKMEWVKDEVARHFNVDREELIFIDYCTLGRERVTIEVIVDGVEYFLICNMEGDEFIQSKSRVSG